MALIANHPVNGSQLSKVSGIARSRIYDVLRSLMSKGYVIEVAAGQYAPLPVDELIRRLKRTFNTDIEKFEKQLARAQSREECEYIWTITGYDNVVDKALDMIGRAQHEIYIRLFPETAARLESHLLAADRRGVRIRYVAMGAIAKQFEIQVSHPGIDTLQQTLGGCSIDIIVDKSEALAGVFETDNPDGSPINWTRNKWFTVASRDSLRHDFYHCFLEKILDQNEALSEEEQWIYTIIKMDE